MKIFDNFAIDGNKVFRCEELAYPVPVKEIEKYGDTTGYSKDEKHYELQYVDDTNKELSFYNSNTSKVPGRPESNMDYKWVRLVLDTVENKEYLQHFILEKIMFKTWFYSKAAASYFLKNIPGFEEESRTFDISNTTIEFFENYRRKKFDTIEMHHSKHGVYIERPEHSFGYSTVNEIEGRIFLFWLGQPFAGEAVQVLRKERAEPCSEGFYKLRLTLGI